ncbi:hypothetical protein ACFQAT_23815 [Undibacterium arcticum]|uniref:Uncharacterized protein n=1 Tax=Undibacterium arcticum TaxID=1762892 RepID=A0ABV7EXJ4_9BURK
MDNTADIGWLGEHRKAEQARKLEDQKPELKKTARKRRKEKSLIYSVALLLLWRQPFLHFFGRALNIESLVIREIDGRRLATIQGSEESHQQRVHDYFFAVCCCRKCAEINSHACLL